MIKATGTQLIGLECINNVQFVLQSTVNALIRRGLVVPNTRILSPLGERVKAEAWARGILGGRCEYAKVYKFTF